MTDRPRLYPGHQHQWTECDLPGGDLVACTICNLHMPRNVAKLDDPFRGLRCQFVDTPLGPVQQCQLTAGHDGDHDYGNAAVRPHQPEQETRADA